MFFRLSRNVLYCQSHAGASGSFQLVRQPFFRPVIGFVSVNLGSGELAGQPQKPCAAAAADIQDGAWWMRQFWLDEFQDFLCSSFRSAMHAKALLVRGGAGMPEHGVIRIYFSERRCCVREQHRVHHAASPVFYHRASGRPRPEIGSHRRQCIQRLGSGSSNSPEQILQ